MCARTDFVGFVVCVCCCVEKKKNILNSRNQSDDDFFSFLLLFQIKNSNTLIINNRVKHTKHAHTAAAARTQIINSYEVLSSNMGRSASDFADKRGVLKKISRNRARTSN